MLSNKPAKQFAIIVPPNDLGFEISEAD